MLLVFSTDICLKICQSFVIIIYGKKQSALFHYLTFEMVTIDAYREIIGSYLTKARLISASAHLSSRNGKHFKFKNTNEICSGIFQTTNSLLYFLGVSGLFYFFSFLK